MKKLFAVVLLLGIVCRLAAQSLEYTFTAPNAAHHEAVISLLAKDLPKGPAIFRMSRSSPGRYATHEFGKNVYNVQAYDAGGKPLSIDRTEADVFVVNNHSGIVKMQYTLYANYADGTYAGIDVNGYHLNMPAVFMWVKGMENAPIKLTYVLPAQNNWSIATQLFPTNDSFTFTAPNLQYFMDAPTKVGNIRYREWKVNNTDGKEIVFRIAYDTEANDAQLDAFSAKVKRIVAEAGQVFGEYPSYETGRYTFLASLNPYVQGDGMEHRNSTMISLPIQAGMMAYATSVFAHEFFHCWNVERIRPKTIEPFNFERSNVCDGLWVAEGFTQYYGSLIETRCGISSTEQFLNLLSSLINAKINRPGGRLYNVIQNSQNAVFSDAGASIDKNNFANTFSSYYSTGGAMALALELELRTRYNKTLDDFMRNLWLKHGKTEIAYTIPDLQNVLAATTGDAKAAAAFFDSYIYKNQPYPYASALKQLGVNMMKLAEGITWIGQSVLEEKNGKISVKSNTLMGTPLYDAGLDIGDEIVSIGGERVESMNALNSWLATKKPGEKADIVFRHRNVEKTSSILLGESPDAALMIDENATEKSISQRNSWLASKVK